MMTTATEKLIETFKAQACLVPDAGDPPLDEVSGLSAAERVECARHLIVTWGDTAGLSEAKRAQALSIVKLGCEAFLLAWNEAHS